jgi:putative acetyltransferase
LACKKEEYETMNPKIVIRTETHDDVCAITEVTIAAFKTLEISNHTEQFIIEALRAAKALTVSLVAEVDGRVVGHIAFSPVIISDGNRNWYGLGPVSVLPECQRKGIGKALIQEGLSRLKALNAQGCCLVGHPDYYRKFGFKNMSDLVHEEVPQEVFFALSFDGHTPQGTVAFHEGFKADGQPIRIETTFEVVSIRCSRSPKRQRRFTSIRVMLLWINERGEA